MKVVALCNKLTRSKTLLKDSEDPEAPDKPAAVVSNMTTGKTAEVRLFFRENSIAVKVRSDRKDWGYWSEILMILIEIYKGTRRYL